MGSGKGKKKRVPTSISTPLASSAISSSAYDEDTEVLEITFRHGGAYEYSDIPRKVNQEFLSATSQGQYYQDMIKGKYPSTRTDSGKQTKTASPGAAISFNDCVTDYEAWKEWLSRSGVAGVGIKQYYLGEKGPITKEQNFFIIGEVFADAVKSNALIMPSGTTEKDFKIRLRAGHYGNYRMEVEHQGSGKWAEGWNDTIPLNSRDDMYFGGKYLIEEIAGVIRRIL